MSPTLWVKDKLLEHNLEMVTFGCQHKKVECPLIKVFLQLLLSSIGICKGFSRESIYKRILEFYDVDLVI